MASRPEVKRYEHLSKDELLDQLYQRDAERKLGLVWERDEVEAERVLNDDFVTLELDSGLSVGQPPFENFLIEGDNFDALRYLHMAYKGRIKCIYIDPPYNLENKDFLYNDSYVDKTNDYPHSTWLEFMYRRLLLARDLLTDDGVLFISIDDTEGAHLALLMDKALPGMHRVGTFVWRRRSGANDAKDWFISVDHEYVLCYANKGFTFGGTTKDTSSYLNPDNDPRGPWTSGDLTKAHNFKQRPDAYYAIRNPDTDVWYLGESERVWAFATESRAAGKKLRAKSIEQLIAEKRILWPQDEEPVIYHSLQAIKKAVQDGTGPRSLQIYRHLDELKSQILTKQAPERLLTYIEPLETWVGRKLGSGKPGYKRFVKDLKRTEKPISTWIMPSSIKKSEIEEIADWQEVTTMQTGFTGEGTKLVSQMLGNKDFPYPKPMSLIKALIGQATDADSGHIILDFFAGSGTTGHAVLALNGEDNGDRAFILVSSTEATVKEPTKNVCRDITARRLRIATEGYEYRTSKSKKQVEALGGEFAYMRAHRVPRQRLAEDISHDQIWFVLQQIHANAISPFELDRAIQLLEGDELGHDIIYVPKLNQAAHKALGEYLMTATKACTVYSWQPGVIQQRYGSDQISVEKIPEYLIERFGSGQ